jgi:hypothetical protein
VREEFRDAMDSADAPATRAEPPHRTGVGIEQLRHEVQRSGHHMFSAGRQEQLARGGHQRHQAALQIDARDSSALEQLLGATPFRQVPRDLRDADDLPGFVSQRRHGQRNRHERAVLALPDRLEMRNTLAAPDPGQHFILFALPILGDDDADRTADRFLGRVAEQLLGTAVPRLDRAVEILAHDRIVGRRDDGGQPEIRGRELSLAHE